MTGANTARVDVVIFGGGIAGLWTLNRLSKLGYQTVLLESARLGQGQTRYAQGIIHGGTKYALTGKLTASSEAIRAMPGRWMECLKGRGEINLSDVRILSEHQYMWSTANLSSRLSGFFASKLMKSRTQTLNREQRPPVFQHERFTGQVYQLDEVVLDTQSVIQTLAEQQQQHIFKVDMPSCHFERQDEAILIKWQKQQQTFSISARIIVLCAGEGNESLLNSLDQPIPRMQRRPLQMVAIKGMTQALYAHCLGASTVPRITITSHPDGSGNWVWYLGGQLAEDGVGRSSEAQIQAARNEMSELFPWLGFSDKQWTSFRIDRAEPLQEGGQRPATAFVEKHGNIITAWPTKMAFAPLLADEVIEKLKDNKIEPGRDTVVFNGEAALYAGLPWQEIETWN